MELKYKNIKFDDYTKNDNNAYWSQICKSCKEKNNISDSIIDSSGSGICGVESCNNESDYYIDFPNNDTTIY